MTSVFLGMDLRVEKSVAGSSGLVRMVEKLGLIICVIGLARCDGILYGLGRL